MKINTFKDINFYKELEEKVSPLIISTIYKYFFFDTSSDENKKNKDRLIQWFDPKNLYLNCLPQPYEGDLTFRQNKKFNLQLHYPTYILLYVINKLYADRKNVLIEDVCCGIGRTEIYLKHLGFTNFHLIDNFSQIEKHHLTTMLKEANLQCSINQQNLNPVISYISAYPSFPKEINKSIELFCHYTNPSMIETLTPSLKNQGFVLLCQDIDNLMVAWCKKEKFIEFKTKLEKYEV